MENATKALLIAAAVLVVIILIAFGMRILNSGSGTQDQADATIKSAAAQAFNKNFEAYVGDRVSPSAVRNLFALIAQNNQSNPTHFIKIINSENKKGFDVNGDGVINNLDEKAIVGKRTDDIKEVKNNKTYIVKCFYEEQGENKGYITNIAILYNVGEFGENKEIE